MARSRRSPLIILFAPGPMAGAERVVLCGARAMAARLPDFELWLLREARSPSHADAFAAAATGVRLRLITVRGRLDLRALLALYRQLHQQPPLALYAHGYKALFYALLARAGASRLLATHHGRTAHSFAVRAYEGLERMLLRRCDRVLAVSSAMQQDLIAHGVPARRVEVLRNMLTRPPADAPAYVASGAPIRLLFLGRLSPEKGADLLLLALAELPPGPRWHLRLAGDGPQRDELRALAEERGLAEQISFLGYCDAVADELQRADLLLLPSRREGLPLSLIEACAAGLPVVACRVGAVAELVRDGYNGVLVEPAHAGALMQGLQRAMHSLPALSAAAQAGRSQVRRGYGADGWAEGLLDLMRRLEGECG